MTATNRISKKTCVDASKATCLSLLLPENSASTVERRLRQQVIRSSLPRFNEEDDADESDTTTTLGGAIPSLERHYVEFAIGFETLMHILGVADLLREAMTAC
ncbi:unnamed protein product [Peronospora destructor]|uniref:Uncharacterized protein n=1 Tax=Peronospora destructor TaxID=86335 RepID=A0AAV0UWU2_9STRA|nr:unnamed protein product [Peronospora destructor]